MTFVRALYVSILSLSLAACVPTAGQLQDRHLALAATEGFRSQWREAGDFQLFSLQKTQVGEGVVVYIEGDGQAWGPGGRPSENPTPVSPIALELAAADNLHRSVYYLARPCQYAKPGGQPNCVPEQWTAGRYGDSALASLSLALDQIARENPGQSLALVGYSGGATVAALLAAQRSDIASLRTVAGNLDTEAFNRHHKSPLVENNPVAMAPKLRDLPQLHFIGARDRIVLPSMLAAYQRALGPSPCSRSQTLPTQGHNSDWAYLWPELLVQALPCE